MIVDWQFIVDGYNKQHASNLTEKQIIQHCYDSTGSIQKVADYLGVAWETLASRMAKLDIPRTRRDYQPHKLAKRIEAIPAIRMRDMTAKQIASECNCHPATVWSYCTKLNREYKKRWTKSC